MKKLLFALLMLFLVGCEEKYPVYSKFHYQSDHQISCLRIMTSSQWLKERLNKSLGQYQDKQCPYILKAKLHDITKCNSSFSTATPKDFTGYITLEIYEGDKPFYKVQSDFQNDKEASFERVIARLKTDIF
ncbi:MAG: hypothetical protein P8Y50_04660 [Sulfurovaceae bacterium]|jgi:hypothetical protein